MKWIIPFISILCSTTLFADNTNWMSQIPSDRVFNQLIIPGTHDSGSYAITSQSKFSLSPDDPLPIWIEAISNILPPSLVQQIVAGWSKTQPYSIIDQLNNGIRYLDFRVDLFPSDGHFYLSHALLSDRLNDALQQVQVFATEHKSEIIIVDINHVFGVTTAAQEEQLVSLLQTYLWSVAIPSTYHATDTIGRLHNSSANVIIVMDLSQPITNLLLAQFAAQSIWHESAINSPWPNVSDIPDLKGALDAEMAARAKIKSHTRAFVLQDIQTENTNQIIDGIIDPSQDPNNIQSYEAPVDADISTWLTQYINQYGMSSLNIVIQDWFTSQSTLVPLAIQYDTQETAVKSNNDSLLQGKLDQLKAWYARSISSASPPSA